MNRKAERLLAAFSGLPEGSLVVEVGCARFRQEFASDGWSTVYLARAAAEHGWEFHSIDVSEEALDIARDLTDGLPVSFHLGDGADWLANSDRLIDGLYLDGAAEPSETLDQYGAAPLAAGAVVVIDDTQKLNGYAHGKADAVLMLMHSDGGWRIDEFETEPGYRMAVATR